jgi:7-cyano-7-deazaguanine synthase in queuosine biosynthesis
MPTPVILLSGGLDSLTLAADVIVNHAAYGYPRAVTPALIHFTNSDVGHRETTKLLLKKQIPFLEKLMGDKFPQSNIVVQSMENCGFRTYDPKKPRGRNVNLTTHKARFKGHDVGRQVLILTVAFNVAADFDSDDIFAAFQMDPWRRKFIRENPDYDVSDDAPRFVKAFNKLSKLGGFIHSQRLITPFLNKRMSKAQIVNKALKLGIEPSMTHWCVFEAYPKTCGKCCSCCLWKDAVKELGFDPAKPANKPKSEKDECVLSGVRRAC